MPKRPTSTTAPSLKKHWDRLHRGDREPFPKDADAQTAWRHFHAGEFQQAVEVGTEAGGAAVNAAVKAQAVYANYLEKNEKTKLALFEEAAGWAEERQAKRAEGRERLLPLRVSRSAATARASPSRKRWRKASAARSRTR